MRKLFLWVLMTSAISTVHAGDLPDNCEAAVDAADRLASDSNQHCDYSEVGLNGVMHRAFAKTADLPSDEVQAAAVNPSAMKNLSRTEVAKFNSAQQLIARRYELLQAAAQQCPKGFMLDGEQYVPTDAQSLTLTLVYHCL